MQNFFIRTSVITSLFLLGACDAGVPIDSTQRAVEQDDEGQDDVVPVQILAFNDFHGNLEPPAGGSGRIGTVNAGGVEYLATHVHQLGALQHNTVVVSAGDLIGGSPLLSALFHDEPTIEAMNLVGLDINGVGNHEFDEGSAELKRMSEGGCHPVDGCLDGDGFSGADFKFLAANVRTGKKHKTLFPEYKIRKFRGVKVAFIGLTLEGTPTIVTPSGVAGLTFEDEADTVNQIVRKLEDHDGIEAFVVMIHEGGFQGGTFNACVGLSGPILDIVDRMDDAVDVVISGHTHQAYNCLIGGKLVTSASSFGRVVTKIDLELDRDTGDVLVMTADNRIVTRDVPADPSLTALLDKYRVIADPLANQVVGSISAEIVTATNAAGESPLGDVIADAQLAATAPAGFGAAVVAFMNPGGIRAALLYPSSPAGEGDGNVTYSEAFTVQPFSNSLVTLTLTGAQIDTLLEQQWQGQPFPRILQVSEGFSYDWSAGAPVGSRVDPTSIRLNGVTIDPAASYRVTVNNFLADGGDNFVILSSGTNRLGGAVDLDALTDYLEANSPVPPGLQDRITRLP